MSALKYLVIPRASVRGIILKCGKIAMMHSKKYDYYKLPCGGIEPGETLEETLIREVREESGLTVKPETIKEFGYVRRIEKGKIEDIIGKVKKIDFKGVGVEFKENSDKCLCLCKIYSICGYLLKLPTFINGIPNEV